MQSRGCQPAGKCEGTVDRDYDRRYLYILWNFITAQGAAEQLKEQLQGYFLDTFERSDSRLGY